MTSSNTKIILSPFLVNNTNSFLDLVSEQSANFRQILPESSGRGKTILLRLAPVLFPNEAMLSVSFRNNQSFNHIELVDTDDELKCLIRTVHRKDGKKNYSRFY